jgi:hypothetical protein
MSTLVYLVPPHDLAGVRGCCDHDDPSREFDYVAGAESAGAV